MDVRVQLAYRPGGSWLHRVSPVAKIAWLAATFLVALVTYHPLPLLVLGAAATAAAVSARVGGLVARAIVALAPIAASVVVLQSLAPIGCQPACTPAASLGPLVLYQEGLLRGLVFALRLAVMEAWAFALLATTHPSDLFAGLRRLHVPFEVGLMAAMSLQLIPVLGQELALVADAQRARGLRVSGPRALLPLLVPVVGRAFERMLALAISLETRGLGRGPRTSYRQVGFGPADAVLAIAGVVVGVAGTAAGLAWWTSTSIPPVALPSAAAIVIFGAAATTFAVVMLAGLRSLLRP